MTDKLEQGDLQKLIDAAARGEPGAHGRLKRFVGGQFENKPLEDVPPAFRKGLYRAPTSQFPKSLDELRHDREYSKKAVDEFVRKVLDPSFLKPAAAMMLYVFMLTKYHDAFVSFSPNTRQKLMQLFRFWDEAHPWVKANICYELRQEFYDKHHRDFCRDFFAKARRYDKIKEEEDERIRAEEDDCGDSSRGSEGDHSQRPAG